MSCMFNRNLANHLLVAAVFGLGTIAFATRAAAESQSFDSEASASAAGWTEFGSRINSFDFGFSATNNAEGASGAGEGGGLLARSQPIGYYGDRTIGGSSDLSIDLHATGRVKFQNINFDGEFYFGWFDASQAEMDNKDFLGFFVQEPNTASMGAFRVRASIDTANGAQMNIPNDTALNFTLDWDADGGAIAGEGLMSVTFSTLDGATMFSSSREGSDGMNFDSFGLISNNQTGGQLTNFWFDDVDYSVIPEPSSLLLAMCGFGFALLTRRRMIRG